MRLCVVLLLLLAPAVVAAQSSHEKTRSSARKKSSGSGSSSSGSGSSSGSDSGWGGCLASLCEVGAEVATSSQEEPDEPEAAGPGYLPPTGYDVAPLVVVEEPAAAAAPPVAAEARTGAAPSGGVIDARVGGAYLFAPLPNAAAELRALLETRGSGPGLELWYTSLLEKQHSGWDQLPLGGARFSLRLGDEELALRLHVGAALLALGPGELLPALDPGAALEAQLGGDGAPWLDLSSSLLLFRGFVAPDVSAGLTFRFDPVYVRGGYGFLWLEGAYTGPSVALGVHL